MKTVVYITREKLWIEDRIFEWDGKDLGSVWNKACVDMNISEARVVLGSDLSSVTTMKFEGEELIRENVLKEIQSWLPFVVDNESFDWKKVDLVPGETWLQVMAAEKSILEKLSLAELITSVGVLLAKKTVGREAPVIIKWQGRESLAVVAVNGLVDLVTGSIDDEELMTYAKQKWGLAVNPEELFFGEKEFNLRQSVMEEKINGEDGAVLNLKK